MRGQNELSTFYCNIHPIEFTEGVCPLCLNERLLVLASLQRRLKPLPACYHKIIQETKNILRNSSKKKLIKLLSFLGFFFQLRHHKFDQETISIISSEDSFISITFEDNGATSWGKVEESTQLENCNAAWDNQYKQVILHSTNNETIPQTKPRRLLTWRKPINQLVHVISFKNRS